MNRFKGYYFKCSGKEHTLALIPASHGGSASLQIITDARSYSLEYPHIIFGNKIPRVKLGGSVFSERKIRLDIDRKNVKAKGMLYFGSLTPPKYDIMGIFKATAPILQCRHRVISMLHKVNGFVRINGEKFVFNNGSGYIEGDEGSSFPKRYIWAQGFFGGGSVMLSVADVPIAGVTINGVIAAIYAYGKEYRLATYLGAKAVSAGEDFAEIKQRGFSLFVKRLSDNSHPLYAPREGKMNRIIRENPKCRLYCRFAKNNSVLLEFITEQGSWESEL